MDRAGAGERRTGIRDVLLAKLGQGAAARDRRRRHVRETPPVIAADADVEEAVEPQVDRRTRGAAARRVPEAAACLHRPRPPWPGNVPARSKCLATASTLSKRFP